MRLFYLTDDKLVQEKSFSLFFKRKVNVLTHRLAVLLFKSEQCIAVQKEGKNKIDEVVDCTQQAEVCENLCTYLQVIHTQLHLL